MTDQQQQTRANIAVQLGQNGVYAYSLGLHPYEADLYEATVRAEDTNAYTECKRFIDALPSFDVRIFHTHVDSRGWRFEFFATEKKAVETPTASGFTETTPASLCDELKKALANGKPRDARTDQLVLIVLDWALALDEASEHIASPDGFPVGTTAGDVLERLDDIESKFEDVGIDVMDVHLGVTEGWGE